MSRTTPRTGEEPDHERLPHAAILPVGDRGDPSPIFRQAALLLAALTAWLLQSRLGAGNEVLWVLGFVALANTLAFLASGVRRFPVLPILSLGTGVAGWIALIHFTGGSSSPFVAGLGLEVVVAASVYGAGRGAWVFLGAVAGLWLQQAGLGLRGAAAELALQSLLLAATGAIAALIRERWASSHLRVWQEAERSRRRLARLEERLEDLRRVEETGGQAVRMAHGLKNAVGSLKGFAGLIRRRAARAQTDEALLKGLDSSVRRLEEIATLLLEPPAETSESRDHGGAAAAERIIRAAVDRARVKHRNIAWVLEGGTEAPVIAFPSGALEEILEVLLDNAAESMGGRGEVRVITRARQGSMQIEVRDQGRGVPPDILRALFRPGRTTKRRGSGFGLFVARKLAESQGGKLEVAAGSGGPGASFLVTVPAGGAR